MHRISCAFFSSPVSTPSRHTAFCSSFFLSRFILRPKSHFATKASRQPASKMPPKRPLSPTSSSTAATTETPFTMARSNKKISTAEAGKNSNLSGNGSKSEPISTSSSTSTTRGGAKAAPVFSIFQRPASNSVTTGSTTDGQSKPVQWTMHGDSFITGEAFHPKAYNTVNAFDLDQTMINVNGKHKWPKNADDWVWWSTQVPTKIQELAHGGSAAVVIITNQAGLDGNSEKQKTMKLKFEKICSRLQCPVWILISMKKDHNRKPNTGLWHWLENRFEQDGVVIDRTKSFYVGDAAGRDHGWKVGALKDFNDTDRKFAENLGIEFHCPEEYFLNHPKITSWQYSFNPKMLPGNTPLFTPTSTPLLPVNGSTREMVIFCGMPASGKSTFAHKHMVSTGKYVYVNQDTLKTREKCIKAAEEAMSAGKSVVIDNTNADAETRKMYVTRAKKHGYTVRCFYFTADKALASHNNHYRAFWRHLAALAGSSTSTSTTTTATSSLSSSPSSSTSKTTTVSINHGSNSEPIRERLSEMVFATYQRRFQPPTMEEGYEEIKNINFVVDDAEREWWERWYN